MAERDVVVIGGGHNGLACAAYLAGSDMDVLVLEKHAEEGGLQLPRSRGRVIKFHPRPMW